MTEKPPVLSDYQIEDIVQDPREVYGAGLVAQAQRDADVAYYEPIIKEFSEAIESWQRRLEQARQDTAREIFEWGGQPCPHAGLVNSEPLLCKRECSACWQSLKEKFGVR